MPFKIGKRSCPDTIKGFIAEKGVFLGGFIEHTEKVLCLQDLEYMLARDRGVKNKVLYTKFIDKKLKYPINIRAQYADRMKELADADDWTHKDWKDNLDSARGECFANLDSVEGSYIRSKFFGEACWATIQSNIKSLDSKIITGAGMLNNRAFINDKQVKACVQKTKLTAILEKKRNKTTGSAKRISEAMFNRLVKAKHKLDMDYKDWQKLVDKHV